MVVVAVIVVAVVAEEVEVEVVAVVVVVSAGFSYGSLDRLKWKEQSALGSSGWLLLVISQLFIVRFQSLKHKTEAWEERRNTAEAVKANRSSH